MPIVAPLLIHSFDPDTIGQAARGLPPEARRRFLRALDGLDLPGASGVWTGPPALVVGVTL